MKSDEVTNGWYLAVQYNESKTSQYRAKELPTRVSAVGKLKQINLEYGLVDARPKESASKLRRK
jgi:hypothetical protein